MATIVVIGGGWAGCAAALTAGLAGEDVFLIERTDMLLGTGLAGGVMRNNGRWTVTEEAIAMGGGEIFKIIDKTSIHRNIDFPGQAHSSIYDVTKIELRIREALEKAGVKLLLKKRIDDVIIVNGIIKAVVTDHDEEIDGDVFVETTGSAGPLSNCKRYGNGCAMCVLRCPSFGGRVSVSEKAGIKERKLAGSGRKYGRISGGCSLLKDSISKELVQQLNHYGKVEVSIPKKLRLADVDVKSKTCPQYSDSAFKEKLIFLDNGHAKLMMPFFPLEKLRQISGFENAIYADPLTGGIGNSIRYLSIAPTDIFLKVKGIDNLFCAGEKIGPIAGHTEAITTGVIAGNNAVRFSKRKGLFSPPRDTAMGDFINYVNHSLKKSEKLTEIYTFSGAGYFERMKKNGLYQVDKDQIIKKIIKLGLKGIFG